MEFYRKLCNNLYWKHLDPGTASYRTRIWLIFVSVVSMIWLALFYDPSDPDNSRSYTNIIKRIRNYFRQICLSVLNEISRSPAARKFKSEIQQLIPEADNILLWHSKKTWLRIKTVLI